MGRLMYSDAPGFTPTALGTSGSITVTGLNVSSIFEGRGVTIEPIHSKGKVGRCWIDIPADSIPGFIDALKSAVNEPECYENE